MHRENGHTDVPDAVKTVELRLHAYIPLPNGISVPFNRTTVFFVILLIYLNKGRNIDYKYSLSARKEFESSTEETNDRIIDVPFVLVIIFYIIYMVLTSFLEKL